jgi:hypothetical protein
MTLKFSVLFSYQFSLFVVIFYLVYFLCGYSVWVSSVGSSNKKRKYNPDDLKINNYLELLARTDPPILRHGVTKVVYEKFGVPLRVV